MVVSFTRLILTSAFFTFSFLLWGVSGWQKFQINVQRGEIAINHLKRHPSYIIVHPGEVIKTSCVGNKPQIIANSQLNQNNVINYLGPKRICDDADCEEPFFMDSFTIRVEPGFMGWIACREVRESGLMSLDEDVIFKGVIGITRGDPQLESKVEELGVLNWRSDSYLKAQLEIVIPSFEPSNWEETPNAKAKADNEPIKITWDKSDRKMLRFWVNQGEGQEGKDKAEVKELDEEEEEEEDEKEAQVKNQVTAELVYCQSISHCKRMEKCFDNLCKGKTPKAANCTHNGHCQVELLDNFVGGMLKTKIKEEVLLHLFFQGLDRKIYFLDEPAPAEALSALSKYSINQVATDLICEATMFWDMQDIQFTRIMDGQTTKFPVNLLLTDKQLAARGYGKPLTLIQGVTLTPDAGERFEVTCLIPKAYSTKWTVLTGLVYRQKHWAVTARFCVQIFNNCIFHGPLIGYILWLLAQCCRNVYYRRRERGDVEEPPPPQQQPQEPRPGPSGLPPRPPRSRTWEETRISLAAIRRRQASSGPETPRPRGDVQE